MNTTQLAVLGESEFIDDRIAINRDHRGLWRARVVSLDGDCKVTREWYGGFDYVVDCLRQAGVMGR